MVLSGPEAIIVVIARSSSNEGEREAWPVQCSEVVFGCERQSLAKRQRAPPKDLRRIRMSIGNHVQQEVCAA